MFLGTFEHVIDNKNRLRIPPKFRKDMQSGMVISKGNDGCLFLLPQEEFDLILSKVRNLPLFDSTAQLPLRLLFSSASMVEEDNQGRFLLPNTLKTFAKINKKILFVGVGTRIEIWSKEVWQEYTKNIDNNFDSIVKGLKDYGI